MKTKRKNTNFRKFKVAVNPMYRICYNFAKSYVLSYLSKVDTIKKIHRAFTVKVFLGGHTVAMVTHCVTKMIATRSPMLEQFFDAIVASNDKEWLQGPI